MMQPILNAGKKGEKMTKKYPNLIPKIKVGNVTYDYAVIKKNGIEDNIEFDTVILVKC